MNENQPTREKSFSVSHRVDPAQRTRRNRHRGGILWLTGLSASGKSTLAVELGLALFGMGCQVLMPDGDNVRHGLSADLGFSPQDRAENNRCVGELAALFAEAGTIVIAAFISPYRANRDRICARHPDFFHEINLDAPIEVCERRDPKGLYWQARAGDLKEFTGVSAPYEPPSSPHLTIHTGSQTVEQSVKTLIDYVERGHRT